MDRWSERNPGPLDDDFSILDVRALAERVIDLSLVYPGLLFAVGLATTWDFPGYYHTFKDTEGNGEPDLPVLVPESFPDQTDEKLTEIDIKRMDADDQAIQTILLGLPEDVYTAINSCRIAKEIWECIRQMMKENIAANLKFLNNLQPEWKRHVTIVRQTKNLRETDFTQIYDFLKMNQDENVGGNGRNQFRKYASQVAYNQQGYNACQNGGMKVAQNTIQNAGVQNGLRVLELGINPEIQLHAEEFDFMAVAGDLEEIEEVNANCILMVNLQHASTFGNQFDKAPVYDTEGSAKVHLNNNGYDNEIFNMFTQEEQYTDLLEPIPELQLVLQNDNHVTYVAPRMVQSRGTIETSSAPNEETRANQETVYCNLVDQVTQVNMVNCNMRATNAELKSVLARYKIQEQRIEISQEKYDKLEKYYQKSVYQEQFLTRKINALHLSSAKQITNLNDEISNLNKQLLKEKSSISSLMEENKKLKHDFKTQEDKFLDKEVDLEARIKDLENILLKKDQTKAQLKQQSLYNGNMLLEEHDPPAVYDLEETLKLAQQSRKKMRFLKKEIKPANYTKINHQSGVFVPQTTKSKEELLLSNVSNMVTISKMIFIPNEDLLDDTTPSVTRKFLNEVKSSLVTLQRVVKQKMTLEVHNWSSSAHKEVKRLQAQLRDLKGKSSDTPSASNTLDPLNQKLESKIIELEFQVLRAWVFENTSKSMKNTLGTSVTPHVDKPKLSDVTPHSKMLHALIPSHSIPQPREFNVVNIGIASIMTNPITDSQRHVIVKENVSSNTVTVSSTGLVHTARTKRPQLKGKTRNDRVPSASKSSEVKKNVTVEEHRRTLFLSKNQKTMSSECNNIKLSIRNDKSETVCGTCKQCLVTANHDACFLSSVNALNSRANNLCANVPPSANQKRHKTQVWKPKQVGSKERLACKPRLHGLSLKWLPSGCSFDLKGKLVAYKETNCPNDDKDCISNPQEPIRKRFPNSIVYLGRVNFVEGLGHNLFSVGQFCDADLEVVFRRNTCFIRDLDSVDLLKGNRFTNLYTINLYDMASASPICLMARATLLSRSYGINDCPTSTSTPSTTLPRMISSLVYQSLNMLKNIFVPLVSKEKAKELLTHQTCSEFKLAASSASYGFTDNETEFKNYVLKEYFDSVDITHETFAAKTPQQNGVVERRNRTLVEAARTMLIFSHAPLFLWVEAIATACYTQHYSIIHRRFNKTPYELIQCKKLDISYLHVFGALCYPKKDREDIGKLGAKGDILFEPLHNEYLGGRPIVVPRTIHVAPVIQNLQALTASMSFQDSAPAQTNSSNTLVSSHNVDEPSQQHSQQQRNLTPSPTASATDIIPSAVFAGDLFINPLATPSTDIMKSKSVKEALTDPAWIESMQEELHQFIRLDHNEENTVIHNKTRLVVKGYQQEVGIDFEESFSPVARMNTPKLGHSGIRISWACYFSDQ
uniref:Retrovirus-related Pol polyprotein from transposon TNT 1-94 n=1 Tax=Tanacetum cinerariifolium TaxID=118510 RepID=A0A6L2MTG7_TANCI|nr:retrovirus-related Pol polyprotein from transposon TNT 1-94 [Tanacetum cinerariifolium]